MQKIRNIALYGLIGILLGISFGSFLAYMNRPVHIIKSEIVPLQEGINTGRQYDAAIRLSLNNGGMCSGVVIDDNYALTAAHCSTVFIGKLNTDEFRIFDNLRIDTNIKARFIAIDKLRDVALVKGDFTKFNNVRPNFQDLKSTLVASCGFPANERLYCVRLNIVGSRYFQYKAQGTAIFKGMSGGPVITVDEEVIGVNSGVYEDGVIIGPLVGLRHIWGI